MRSARGYALQVLDFEKPLEFGLKRVPEYGTLEELAQQEQGSLDTHDGTSIISMGERVDEGILISWYVYNEDRERSVIIGYNPMRQEIDMPTISGAAVSKSCASKASMISARTSFWDCVTSGDVIVS